jgi:hypothetical protein
VVESRRLRVPAEGWRDGNPVSWGAMDAFSHLSVLLSIIVGLAIAQLLQGLGQLMQGRQRVRWYWPAAVWMATLLLIYVQSWWAMFGLRNVQVWTFGAFAVVLLQTVLEYLLAALLTPTSFGSSEVDLRSHFFEQQRPFFAVLVLVLVVSLAKEFVLGGVPAGANLGFHLAWMAIAVAAMATRRDWFQALAAVASLVGVVGYIALLFVRLR